MSREYYHSDPKRHRESRKLSKERNLKRNQLYVWEWLSKHPCVDCGETDIVVLEFDHTRDKEDSIAHAMGYGWPLEKLRREIDKCEVRRANCHRRKTAMDEHWRILKYGSVVSIANMPDF